MFNLFCSLQFYRVRFQVSLFQYPNSYLSNSCLAERQLIACYTKCAGIIALTVMVEGCVTFTITVFRNFYCHHSKIFQLLP